MSAVPRMTRALLALTLHRPWSSLITHGFKSIENRSWSPYGLLSRGQWIAIHAGQTWDDECKPFALERGVPAAFFDDPTLRIAGAIVGVARYEGFRLEDSNPWFVGPIGWLFDKAVAIEPVPCRGYQKLWRVPDDVAMRVRAAFRTARREEIAA